MGRGVKPHATFLHKSYQNQRILYTVEFQPLQASDTIAIQDLFVKVFSDSEGEQEGEQIGNLAKQLIATTPAEDLYGFVAVETAKIIGAIFFSRLSFPQGPNVFILGPVAVQTEWQGRGVGQALIRYGLQQLKQAGVAIVVTYGDPAFYSKVGFQPLSQTILPAPMVLSQPEGWLGQPLTQRAISPLSGSCSCVEALNHPIYW